MGLVVWQLPCHRLVNIVAVLSEIIILSCCRRARGPPVHHPALRLRLHRRGGPHQDPAVPGAR